MCSSGRFLYFGTDHFGSFGLSSFSTATAQRSQNDAHKISQRSRQLQFVGQPEMNTAVSTSSSLVDCESLDFSFGIGEFDVLCGRDKNAFNNAGNRRFRFLVSQAMGSYLRASTRSEKSVVIRSVVEMVRCNGGRFLQESVDTTDGTKHYMELDEKKSHEKAGHALRDMALLRGTKSKKPTSKKSSCSLTTSSETPLLAEEKVKSSSPLLICEFDEHMDQNLSPYPQSSFHCGRTCTEHLIEENWDDASDVSIDESAFDDLVRSIAEATDTTKIAASLADATDTTKIAADRRLTPPAMMLLPVVSDDAGIYSENCEVNAFLCHLEGKKDRLIQEKRMSANSIVVDDHVLSWLVGEVDFV